MLELRDDDIFESGCEAITNACNCIGIMGAGLAKAFRHKFPVMHKDYQKACEEGLKPGQMHIWKGTEPTDPKYIVNFPTKNDLSPSRMEYITDGLTALKADIERLGIKSIALPALGCGLGGLPFPKVKLEIEKFAASLPDVQVVLYKPK